MKVVAKSINKLKKYARHLGGDMSETLHYFIRMDNGELLERGENPDTSFTAKGLHVLEHGEEFLVVDRPNPISKQEYEQIKVLFEEQK